MTPKPASRRIKWRSWALRVLGSGAFLAVLLALVPLDQLLAALRQIPLWLFAGVFAGFVLGHAVAAAKWWSLMGAGFPFALALRAHFAGLAANLCLPTVAGGDAVRAAMAWRHMRDTGRIAAAALADRMIDLAALAAIAVATGIGHDQGPATALTALAVILGLGAVGLWVMPAVVTLLWTRVPSLPMRATVLALVEAVRDLKRRPLHLVLVWTVSVVIQGFFIVLALALAHAAGLEIAAAPWAFAWALAKIISILPVSINGLGLREASLAALLAPTGAPAGLVVAAGLAWQLILFATGLLGAIVLALAPARAAPAPSESIQP